MSDQGAGREPEARVAVYIDFDNIVISRYDQLHGRGRFHADRAKSVTQSSDERLQRRVTEATVDIGAILDYASSFGTMVLSQAYADWSQPVNAGYRQQLLGRAVDLTQLFPSTRGQKNGADIRLAIDVVEDLFRLPDITHVVLVAGDSDYIALAQRAKRLGRTMVGIGVAGSTSRSLAAACDEFVDYDDVPGTTRPEPVEPKQAADEAAEPRSGRSRKAEPKDAAKEAPAKAGAKGAAATSDAAKADAAKADGTKADAAKADAPQEATGARRSRRASVPAPAVLFAEPGADNDPEDEPEADPQEQATQLLVRALRVVHQRDDDEWLHASVVKAQMKRMDPSFNERAIGLKSFSDFIGSRESVVEMTEDGQARLLRLRDGA